MSSETQTNPYPVSTGVGRSSSQAGGTLLALLILLTVLPSAAAVSSRGADAAALATLVEVSRASRAEVSRRAQAETPARPAGAGASKLAAPEPAIGAADEALAVEHASWIRAMAPSGLGAMPPPVE